jgi:hypothetical protein
LRCRRSAKAVKLEFREQQALAGQRTEVLPKALFEDRAVQRYPASAAHVLQLLAVLSVDVEIPDPRLLPHVSPARLADLIEPRSGESQQPRDPMLGTLLASRGLED